MRTHIERPSNFNLNFVFYKSFCTNGRQIDWYRDIMCGWSRYLYRNDSKTIILQQYYYSVLEIDTGTTILSWMRATSDENNPLKTTQNVFLHLTLQKVFQLQVPFHQLLFPFTFPFQLGTLSCLCPANTLPLMVREERWW